MSNIPTVIHIANKLGPLRNQFVFVGGSIVELLLDKTYPLKPRVTHDVDTIVEFIAGDVPRAMHDLKNFYNDLKK